MNKQSKKKPRKKPAGRRTVKRTAPGQAEEIMKTFGKLEIIKDRLIPSDRDKRIEAEAYIELAKENRSSGEWDEDEAFSCLAFFIVNVIAEQRQDTDEELARISMEMRKKEKEHGLKDEDEYWPRGEGPDDIEELRGAYDYRVREIEMEAMREYGEDEMADLYWNNYPEFNRRHYRGAEKTFKKSRGTWTDKDIKGYTEFWGTDGLPGFDK